MITNERQYKITKAQIEKFKQIIELLKKESISEDRNTQLLQKVQKDAILSQIGDFEDEIREYEALKV